ncbi:prealbumin-like fold domain-containing protein [Spirillospora sp. CA-253888]
MTFAARQCPQYTDIMANLARNNIQESLRDLGKDTVYTSGQPIDPAVEEPNHPNCDPLVGWKFTWGNGVGGKTDLLSTVTGPAGQTAATKPSTPWLDPQGVSTGKSLKGAVTVTLNDQQRQLLTQGRLWTQGGTVSDPLLNGVFGRGKYGFGAFRCAVDDLNGDNVETVAFPSGRTHVFCYYYAVTPPPGAGKIVVRKKLEGGGDHSYTFNFNGNVSYNPGGAFQVAATPGKPGEISFDRGETRPGDEPWDFTENVPPGWRLDSVDCDSDTGKSTTDVNGAKVQVTLAAGDTVTCTYTDQRVFAQGISIYKQTIGGTGGPFDFAVQPVGINSGSGSATTSRQATPELAGVVQNAPAGTYTITEDLPAPTGAGRWVPMHAECVDDTGTVRRVDSDRLTGTGDVRHTVTLTGRPAHCVFTNRFEPAGQLTIEKRTIGGYGRADFQIRSTASGALLRDRTREPARVQVTTRPGGNPASVTLKPLPLGRYFVTELHPPGAQGAWQLTEIVCDGRRIPVESATAGFFITDQRPKHTCRFTDTRIRRGELRVEKLINDPHGLRTGPVSIDLTCRDGQRAHLKIKPRRSGLVQLPKPLTFTRATRCRVQETATGARGPVKVTTRHAVDHGKPAAGGTIDLAVSDTRATTVRLINTYKTTAPIK